MPNCFTLTRKTGGEPVPFQTIDEELCAHLDVPVHPTEWVAQWYNIIGFSLACGKTLGQVVKTFEQYVETGGEAQDKKLLQIALYLQEHFVANAWCER